MAKRDLLFFSPDFQDYVVAAIHISAEPHQIAWLLNNLCETEFWRNPDDFVIPSDKGESRYIYFKFTMPETGEIYFLISNNGTGGSLISSRPKPDYLLVSNSENSAILVADWMDILKKESQVTHAYISDPNQVSKMLWLAYLNELND